MAALATGGLPGVTALHIRSDGDVPAAAALGGCADLRSLYLTHGDVPARRRLGAAAAAALVEVAAAAEVRSLWRMVLVDHLLTPRRSVMEKAPPVADRHTCAEQVARLGAWQPDVAVA